MKNPYSLVFGIEPTEFVSRLAQNDEIVDSLVEGIQRIFMVTGVRGSGKTVFLTHIKSQFLQMKDWEVVELSTERDMLNGLVSKLGNQDSLLSIFRKAKINLSMFGIGIEVEETNPISDVEVALEHMLKELDKHHKKVLVLVDEAIDNKQMREFASVFQILIRDGLPLYLMMTGLHDNIDDLQNEKNLTFLHRAPKIRLSPLSIGTMAGNYKKNLNLDRGQSVRMAQLTKGYSYAFQVLGYCMWENKNDYESSVNMMKQYLEEYVYDKIWSELSGKDKVVAYAIATTPTGKVKDIREKIDMKSNEFGPYKKRLIRKGIVGDDDGYARFTLPLFDEFVQENFSL